MSERVLHITCFATAQLILAIGAYFLVSFFLTKSYDLHQEVGELAAQSQRLSVLLELLDQVQEGEIVDEMGRTKVSRMSYMPPNIMQFESLSFSTPNKKQTICAEQDLTLSEGRKIVVEHYFTHQLKANIDDPISMKPGFLQASI